MTEDVIAAAARVTGEPPGDVAGAIVITVGVHGNIRVVSTASRPDVTIETLSEAADQVRKMS